MPRLNATLKDRIKSRSTEVPSGCWEWNLRRDRDGYGHTKVAGRSLLAHRASYDAFIGPIPAGMTLDHLCRNKCCVNPDHLEPVSNKENILRSDGITAQAARQTHCRAGHAFDAENTYYPPGGGRHCRMCNRARTLKYKSKEARP